MERNWRKLSRSRSTSSEVASCEARQVGCAPAREDEQEEVLLVESDDDSDVIMSDAQRLDQRILRDVVAYVEVRTKTDNRSKGVSKQLELLGAKVSKNLSSDVTHVIWKDGKKSTLDRAVKKGVSVVSVLWIESCKQNQERVAESLFPVAMPDHRDVLQTGRLKRMKSMQPKPLEEDVERSLGRGVRKTRRREAYPSPAPLNLSPGVLVADTQPDTPVMSAGPHTPSLIPDTPSHMKACLDLLDSIKKQKGSAQRRLSAIDSPNISPCTPLQQRLFHCFAEEAAECSGQTPSTSVRLHKSGPTKRAVSRRRLDGTSKDEDSPMGADSPKKTPRGRVSKGTPRSHKSSDAQTNDQTEEGVPTAGKQIALAAGEGCHDSSGKPGSRSDIPVGGNTGDESSTLRDKSSTSRDKSSTSQDKSSTSRDKSSTSRDKRSTSRDKSSTSRDKSSTSRDKSSTSRETSCTSRDKSSRTSRRQSRGGTSRTAACPSSGRETASLDKGLSISIEPQGSTSEEPVSRDVGKEGTNSKGKIPEKRPGRSGKSLEVAASSKADKLKDESEVMSSEDSSKVKESVAAGGQPRTKKRKLLGMNTEKLSSEGCCQNKENNLDSGQNAIETTDKSLSKAVKREKKGARSKTQTGERDHGREAKTVGIKDEEGAHSALDSQLSGSSVLSALNSQNTSSIEDFKHTGAADKQTTSQRKALNARKRKKVSSSASGETSSQDDAPVSEVKEHKPKKKQKKVTLSDDQDKRRQKKPTLVMTSLHRSDQEIVMSVVNDLGGFAITDTVCETTTHVVIGENRRTLNVLSGMARGSWLLSMDWVYKSIAAGAWLPEEAFEMSDHFPGAMTSRLAHCQEAEKSADTDIFSSFGALYIPAESSPPRDRLVELVELCGGHISRRLADATLCVGSGGRRKKGSLPVVAERWILDSITKYQPLPWEPYLMKES